MLGHLKANDGVCNLAVAGVDVLYGDYAEGLVYSWTTLRCARGAVCLVPAGRGRGRPADTGQRSCSAPGGPR